MREIKFRALAVVNDKHNNIKVVISFMVNISKAGVTHLVLFLVIESKLKLIKRLLVNSFANIKTEMKNTKVIS